MKPSSYVISYLNLRRTVGWIAILLPFGLRAGVIVLGTSVPGSVSGYYYSPMRNVLVAALCVLGVFLISYNGYDRLDSAITNVAGVAAIGVAFFPTSSPSFRPAWVGHVHPIFAGVALTSQALMALLFLLALIVPFLRNFYELATPTGEAVAAWAIGTALGVGAMLGSSRLLGT